MKKLLQIILLSGLMTHAFSNTTGTGTTATDPLDSYVDPDTQIDYKAEYDTFSADKKKHVLNRCTMFVIQNEMGQTGEAAMSTQEIETYESKVLKRCEAVLNKHMWGKDCTKENQKDCEKTKTLDGRLHEVEREGNLLTYTMDQCVKRLQLTKANCEHAGGLEGTTCVLDFRRQCYDFITQESTYLEDPSRELRTCAEFEDQTKTIALDCRSYCYQKKVCEIKDEDFLNRVIGNIYLRKKKGFSSCVKDKSFGVAGDNKIWVHQSCYGEFGIQYKDPDCGYRPTCDIKPFDGEHIPVSGREDTFVTCDGNGSARPNDLDPRQNAASNGKVWCKAHIFKKDKNGKLTDEIDDTKEVSRIYTVDLVEKLGPHKCNPGGNGSPIDYSPKNKGNFDGGWGVEVMNYCHGRFKMNVAWKKKSCTMAGEKSESGNTCCNGLVLDEETNICNVPEYIAAEVPETQMLENFNANQQCNKQLDDHVIRQAEIFFQELAVYENMFSQLDGRSDPINKISLIDKKENEEVELNRKLEDKAIKSIHDAIISFRHSYATVKLDYEEINNKIQCDMRGFMKLKTAEMGRRFEDKNLPVPTKPCKWTEEIDASIDAYIAYINAPTKPKEEVKLMAIPEDSFFREAEGMQIASKIAQDLMIESNIAYTKGIMDALDAYVVEIDKAALVGQNLVWNCAHKENCSQFSWLVKHAEADRYGRSNVKKRDEFRVITDLLHSPIYPSKLLKSKAKILPELEPGYKKYLYNKDQYVQTEKEISEFSVYEPVIDYLRGTKENMKQPEVYKQVFQLYSQELPLRNKSILNEDSLFSSFRFKLEDNTKYSKNGNNDAQNIPQFCEMQTKTNYQVRVPFGKALIPLRMSQINTFLYKYVEAQKNLLEHQTQCSYNLSGGNANYKSTNYNVSATGTNLSGNNAVDNSKKGTTLSNLISNLPQFDGKSILGNNLLANKYLTNRASSQQAGAAAGSSIGNVDSSAKSAIFESNRNNRVRKLDRAVKQAKKKRNDSLIGKYVDSLKNSYGKAMNAASNSSLFNKLRNRFLNSGLDSDSSKKATGDANRYGKSKSFGGDSSGSASFSGGDGLRRQSKGTGGFGGSDGSGSGYGNYGNNRDSVTGLTKKESEKILDATSNSKLNVYRGDTLFEKISNRYIKSAYPHLLKFRPKRKTID